jgi:excisionase family DNA binding protein
MEPRNRAERRLLASNRYDGQPFGLSPGATAHRLHASKSTVYRLLRSGQLRGVKRGASTLILTDSIAEYESSLPAFESHAA